MEFLYKIVIFVIFLKATFCLVEDPFIGYFNPKCVIIRSMKCPNENITFWLYTRETEDDPIQLDPLNLTQSNFPVIKPAYILVHGYTGNRHISPNHHIRPALLAKEDAYVISIDYAPLVRSPCYYAAVQNAPLVSKCLAQLINRMIKRHFVPNRYIHMIGFSLGAHVAGQTSNYLKHPLNRLTGLDPAGPLFEFASAKYSLDSSDAKFVDVIHTNVMGRGILKTMGHVDFYPNIGFTQPGCKENFLSEPGSCSHDRAPQYYAESIYTTSGFWAYSCANWFVDMFGLCDTTSNDALMGHFVNRNASGLYFLKTARSIPFALGPNRIPGDFPVTGSSNKKRR